MIQNNIVDLVSHCPPNNRKIPPGVIQPQFQTTDIEPTKKTSAANRLYQNINEFKSSQFANLPC